MKAVVILGAGGSVDAGLPMLGSLWQDDKVKKYIDTTEYLKPFLESLGIRFGVGSLKACAWNIEEVLTFFELRRDGFLQGYSGLLSTERDAIKRELLVTIYYAVFHDRPYNHSDHYNKLIKFCSEQFEEVTWASFNWDCKLEQAFYHSEYTVNGKKLDVASRTPKMIGGPDDWPGLSEKHTLLKLHGSVNWFVDNDQLKFVRYGKENGLDDLMRMWTEYKNGSNTIPFIAEPSFFKSQDIEVKNQLLESWRAFDKRIEEAEAILIVGYSFPEGDVLARCVLMNASRAKTLKRVVVIDPGLGSIEKVRYLLPEFSTLHYAVPLAEWASKESFKGSCSGFFRGSDSD